MRAVPIGRRANKIIALNTIPIGLKFYPLIDDDKRCTKAEDRFLKLSVRGIPNLCTFCIRASKMTTLLNLAISGADQCVGDSTAL